MTVNSPEINLNIYKMLLGDLLNSAEPTYGDFVLFLGFFIFAIIGCYLGINFIISLLFNRNPEA